MTISQFILESPNEFNGISYSLVMDCDKDIYGEKFLLEKTRELSIFKNEPINIIKGKCPLKLVITTLINSN